MLHNLLKRCFLVFAAGLLSAAMAVSASAAVRERLDTVEDTYWDDDKISVGRWEEVDGAFQYEIYLYRDDSRVSTYTTKNTYVNMKSGMKKVGNYYFKVRALVKSSSKSYYNGYWSEESDSIYLDEERVEFVQNGSVIDTQNTGPGAADNDGTMAIIRIPQASVMGQEGWIEDANGRYYRFSDGKFPARGWWQQPDTTNWFFLNENGYVVTGWVQPKEEGPKYYCQAPEGVMVTGDATVDGILYHFDASGALIQ